MPNEQSMELLYAVYALISLLFVIYQCWPDPSIDIHLVKKINIHTNTKIIFIINYCKITKTKFKTTKITKNYNKNLIIVNVTFIFIVNSKINY